MVFRWIPLIFDLCPVSPNVHPHFISLSFSLSSSFLIESVYWYYSSWVEAEGWDGCREPFDVTARDLLELADKLL